MNAFHRQLLHLLHRLPDNPLGHRLALLLRRPIKYSRNPTFLTRIWGLELQLSARGNVSETRLLCTPQFLDGPERQCIAGLIDEVDGPFRFLDVGANIGTYTYWVLAHSQGRAHIKSFEANPALAHRLQENLARNEARGVHLHNVALSPTLGTIHLHLHPSNLGQSSLLGPDDPSHSDSVEVEARPLSTFIDPENAPPDLLKIDIEGAEYAVLKELVASIAPPNLPRRILCEFKDDPQQEKLAGLLNHAGYQLELDFGLNRLYRISLA